MEQCSRLENCKFFIFTENTKNVTFQYALKGFILIYCRGPKSGKCIRKDISIEFGKEKVPENMMPNGFPLRGTNSNKWDLEVKKYLFERYGVYSNFNQHEE